MVLVLVVGDLHVPQRASGIPDSYRKMFAPGRIQIVCITGNVGCKEMYDYFRVVAPDVYCTNGEYDCYWNQSLPDTQVIQVEELKIGLIHGHQVVPPTDRDALAMVQRQLDVDVLLSGASHSPKIFEFDGRLFVNPGSITGAFTGTDGSVLPSFVLLDIRGKSITSFSYQKTLSGNDHTGEGDHDGTRIKKKEWTKEY